MLYKLIADGDKFGGVEPLPFLDAADLQKKEKDIENLLADHLLDVLFEDAALLPIFQERQLQAEADLYALDKNGNLVIFELKRGIAGEDAILQAIRYSQTAGQWSFSELQRRYQVYLASKGVVPVSLLDAHRDAFQLEHPLSPSDFNRRQVLYVVGNAANDRLVNAISYWKTQGLTVEFLPYRIYQINHNNYFEFFSLPFDMHQNPATVKGVLFDTNRSYYEAAIWDMMEKSRVSAYGDVKRVVGYLGNRDIVFYSHKWLGIVAAAEVIGPLKKDGENEEYRDVRFLTKVPRREDGVVKYMPFSQVTQLLGKSFFWARTIKVPYLSREEAQQLLGELKNIL